MGTSSNRIRSAALFALALGAQAMAQSSQISVFQAQPGAKEELRVRLGSASYSAEQLKDLQFLSSKGKVGAAFDRLDEDCFEDITADDPENPDAELPKICHQVGVFKLKAPGNFAKDEILVALKGAAPVESAKAPEIRELSQPVETQLQEWIAEEYKAPEAAAGHEDSYRYRWETEPASKKPAWNYMYKSAGDPVETAQWYKNSEPLKPYPIEGCKLTAIDDFVRLACANNVWLYQGRRLVTLSNTDEYGPVRVDLLSSFDLNGQRAYAVVVAIKMRVVAGVLVLKDGKWQLIEDVPHGGGGC